MNELNMEMLKGEAGFFAMLLLLVVACGMGIWREYRWARVCNAEYDKGYIDGVVYITGRASAVMSTLEEAGDLDVPGVDLDTYSASGSAGSEGFEAAHRGEVSS